MNQINQSINQVAITLSLVFVTLLIRSTYSFIQAYASFTSAIVQSPDCIAEGALGEPCIDNCRTLGFVIKNWLFYTPAFR
jgi:hypothetical protein